MEGGRDLGKGFWREGARQEGRQERLVDFIGGRKAEKYDDRSEWKGQGKENSGMKGESGSGGGGGAAAAGAEQEEEEKSLEKEEWEEGRNTRRRRNKTTVLH